MRKLTASIICKNEEEMLPIMLDSIKGIDEIIVLDTGSTDKSIEIAKSYGAKVFKDPWRDDFSYSRNACKKHCTGDWLLIIDCDEVLECTIEQIKSMINSEWANRYDLLLFDVQTGLERNEQPRLIKNKKDIWYYGAAHNLPRYYPDGLDSPHTSRMIPNDKTFKTTFRVTANCSPNHAKDPDRTLRILETALSKEPMNTRNLYYYVREWLNRKDPARALYWLGRYFKIAQMTNERADAHFIAATCHLDLGDPVSAIDECMNAIKILPTFKAPYQLLEMLAHDTMKQQWHKMAQSANNAGVLFVRDMHPKQKPKSNLKVVKK